MKESGFKKCFWFIAGAVALFALVAPLIYAVIKVDRIPGLVIDKDYEAK